MKLFEKKDPELRIAELKAKREILEKQSSELSSLREEQQKIREAKKKIRELRFQPITSEIKKIEELIKKYKKKEPVKVKHKRRHKRKHKSIDEMKNARAKEKLVVIYK